VPVSRRTKGKVEIFKCVETYGQTRKKQSHSEYREEEEVFHSAGNNLFGGAFGASIQKAWRSRVQDVTRTIYPERYGAGAANDHWG
jgi:hypothetical protein